MTDHECDLAGTCPVCGGCLACTPHPPGRWIEVKGHQTVAGGCRDALEVMMLDNLDLMEQIVTGLLGRPGTSPRTRRMAEDLARQLGADRDSILGTGHL